MAVRSSSRSLIQWFCAAWLLASRRAENLGHVHDRVHAGFAGGLREVGSGFHEPPWGDGIAEVGRVRSGQRGADGGEVAEVAFDDFSAELRQPG